MVNARYSTQKLFFKKIKVLRNSKQFCLKDEIMERWQEYFYELLTTKDLVNITPEKIFIIMSMTMIKRKGK